MLSSFFVTLSFFVMVMLSFFVMLSAGRSALTAWQLTVTFSILTFFLQPFRSAVICHSWCVLPLHNRESRIAYFLKPIWRSKSLRWGQLAWKINSQKWNSDNNVLLKIWLPKFDFRKWTTENGLPKFDFRNLTSENGLPKIDFRKMDFRKWTSENGIPKIDFRKIEFWNFSIESY